VRRYASMALACLGLGRCLTGPAAASTASVTVTPAVVADRSPSGAQCQDYWFPVTMTAEESATYRVFGRLCAPGSPEGRTIHLLLHGGTYNHTYWDWPLDPARYSYVEAATRAGFATLALDRLGYGHSDHPASWTIDYDVDAWVVHQVVQDLRRGTVGRPFERVILVGHSVGGFTTFTAAGRYPDDADGIIVSGASHILNWPGVTPAAAAFHPAEEDPKFQDGRAVPHGSGYLTTRPGRRCEALYYGPGVDPSVCALDEELKDTIAFGEMSTFGYAAQRRDPSDRIVAPALVVLGDHDRLMCDKTCSDPQSSAAREREYYPKVACYEQYIEPDSGHMNNLHRSAPDWYRVAMDWAVRRVGVTTAAHRGRSC
jgi:pimeloyl-ACP methyl ester carboxylesterase